MITLDENMEMLSGLAVCILLVHSYGFGRNIEDSQSASAARQPK